MEEELVSLRTRYVEDIWWKNIHPSDTDYILENKFDQFQI